MNDTLQIVIALDDQQVGEQLIAELSEIGFDAFEERDRQLFAFIDAEKFEQLIFEDVLEKYPLHYTVETIPDQNWNELWESNFQPVVIDDFCAIRASFHSPFPQLPYEIVITPKMSFGTGHHATTFMMISNMKELDFNNKKVADFGTGTAVLAILAEKLGSKAVWAIDNDDWSIENAEENIRTNNCERILLEKRDTFNPQEQFDIILANINKNVILANTAQISRGVTVGGQVLLSGLLKDDEGEIVAAFEKMAFHHTFTVERDKWICLLLQYQLKSE